MASMALAAVATAAAASGFPVATAAADSAFACPESAG